MNLERLSIDVRLALKIIDGTEMPTLLRVHSLRLIVNYFGFWSERFTPSSLRTIGSLFPDLEELVLDQAGLTEVSSLPGDMASKPLLLSALFLHVHIVLQNEWAQTFRIFPRLRRLAFASLFIMDVHEQRAVDAEMPDSPITDGMMVDDEEDNALGTPLADDDVMAWSFRYNLCMLAVWADTFLDECLRLPSLSEIWFLGIDTPLYALEPNSVSDGGVGFLQKSFVDVDPDGQTRTHFIITPTSGPGWWWDCHFDF